MKIDGRFLRGEPLERWFTYSQDFELLLRFPEPSEWKATLGDKPDAANDDAIRSFVAAHVKEWRNLDDESGPIPCTAPNAVMFMKRDPRFATWLMLRLGDAASFRNPARDGAARPAGDEVAPAAPV